MHQRRNFRLTKPLSVINLFKLRPSNFTAADANTANDGTDTEDSETVRASVRRPPFASLSPCLLSSIFCFSLFKNYVISPLLYF